MDTIKSYKIFLLIGKYKTQSSFFKELKQFHIDTNNIDMKKCLEIFAELHDSALYIRDFTPIDENTIKYNDTMWVSADKISEDLNLQDKDIWLHIKERQNFVFITPSQCYISLKLAFILCASRQSTTKMEHMIALKRDNVCIEFFVDDNNMFSVREASAVRNASNTVTVSRNDFKSISDSLKLQPQKCVTNEQFNILSQSISKQYCKDCSNCISLLAKIDKLTTEYRVASVERNLLHKVMDHTMSQQRISSVVRPPTRMVPISEHRTKSSDEDTLSMLTEDCL